jgi:serine/threonine protein kinase/tetratricopeptide (TPR) repeat protein
MTGADVNCPRCRLENPETARFCADCGAPLRETGDAPDQTMTLETPREELATGSTFAGRYQIIEELGKGGMGHVYKVYDREIHSKIALKLIKPEVAADRNTIERFRNELRMARDISHKHICRMYDLGREGRLYYITMEYVSGEDLKAMIRMSGRLGIGTAVTVARQLCEGLAEAHRRGIVHRDLKPSNVMIDREGQVRILDFGIARSIRSKGLTGAGIVIGTPEYMSPEQVEGGDVDARSDLYSLGIILFECLAGRVPFEGDTPFSVGIKQKSEKPGDPRDLNPDIPEDLDRLILKCLEKDPRRRYQTAEELGAELEKIAKRIPTTERILPRRKPSTARSIFLPPGLKKAVVPAVLLAIAAVAAAGWFFLLKKGGPASPSHRHSVAVMTFENQTGDRSYDYLGKAIPNLLITSLEQSPDLSVVTWERMRDLLKQMGRDESETIDADLGFELCRKEGVGSIVLGSFVKAGDVFATDVKVLDVATKRLLKSGGSKGDGLRSILDRQIGDLSREISKGVGLSDREFPAGKVPIAEKTTSSMEAYNLFLKGRDEYEKFYYDDARKSLGQAVALDPEFAVAYLVLARVNGALTDIQGQNNAYERAMALSAKATEKDRLYIQAAYAGAVEMDQKKRLELLRRLLDAYPKEKDAHYELATFLRNEGRLQEAVAEYDRALALDPNYGYALNQIAYSYADMGDYGKAIASFERYAALYPGDANPLDSMAETYFRMGDLDRAAAAYSKAIAVKPDFYSSYAGLAYVAALREDYPGALGWLDQFIATAPSPGLKGTGHYNKSLLLYWTGQYGRAEAELRKVADLNAASGLPQGKSGIELGMGWIAEARGEFEPGRKHLKSCFDSSTKAPGKASPGTRAYYLFFLGILDIEAGSLDAARAELKEIDALLPQTEAHGKDQLAYYREHLKGEVLLAEGAADKAAVVLQKLPPIGKPPTIPGILPFYSTPFLKDALARAYLAQGALDKAVAEYVRLMTLDPGKDDRSLINPRYHYRLAKIFERNGLAAKALEQYRRFLVLWKDADRDHPDYVDAVKRLAALEKH